MAMTNDNGPTFIDVIINNYDINQVLQGVLIDLARGKDVELMVPCNNSGQSDVKNAIFIELSSLVGSRGRIKIIKNAHWGIKTDRGTIYYKHGHELKKLKKCEAKQ